MRDKADPEVFAHLRREREFYDTETAGLRGLVGQLTDEILTRVATADQSARWREGDHEYFTRVIEGKEFTQFCRVEADGTVTVLLDENELLQDSAYIELGVRSVSPDGRLLAYSVDLAGEEVFELRFRDLQTLTDLVDRVDRTYTGCAWSADSTTFFYVVHDELYRPFQVWRHRLGTAASDDVLVYEEDDPKFDVYLWGDRAGDYIIIHLNSRDTSEVHVVDAHDPKAAPRVVAPRRAGIEYGVSHQPGPDGGWMLIVTNEDATQFQLVRTPVRDTSMSAWQLIIPEILDERLHDVDVFDGHVVLQTVTNGKQQLRLLSWDALFSDDPLAASVVVDAGIPGGQITLGHNEVFASDFVLVEVESYIQPMSWQRIDLRTGSREVVRERLVPHYQSEDYILEERWVTARDGEQIPVRVARHRSTPLDGSAPLLLWGYGAYESAFWPGFEPWLASVLDRGVVFAHAGIRGGGYMGRQWWLEGRLEKKINTFYDFIDVADSMAADHLIDSDRIISRGMSAGGLLQGGVYSLRPDRWHAVIAEVPFVDVVTTMLDEHMPLTANEHDEWGDPRIRSIFDAMLDYSPYDNIPTGDRPDLLVTGAWFDPRVMVHEPAKWVARLRELDGEGRVLFRPEIGAGGHSGPTGRFALQAYEAEIVAFVLDECGLVDAPLLSVG